ncbi:carbohydrate kinase family protein [Methylomarinum vadi]|uniref:carbohydrate kinase family protein n=1 Tax=Methylomarinum vadi TaxID=438855 RepID=UPI0004DF103A|nr:PfkB family carbohydrate kinase [Methylomarinum vadi]
MTTQQNLLDVLCVGHACYDLIFSVDHHPDEDEKLFAQSCHGVGGGPAANAAVIVARLGFHSAFAGYLGNDLYGDKHRQEFIENGVADTYLIRGANPTPISAIIVKPDGKRALINYKGDTRPLPANALDFSGIDVKTVLFDGHEPELSLPLADYCRNINIPTVLDAGSVHQGTLALMNKVDYLVCSEKFAVQFAGNEESALSKLAEKAPTVVITLGQRGLIWQTGQEHGSLAAFPIDAIDSTGAGDAFHGAFAAAVAAKLNWQDTLRYASAAGAICCTRTGAREGLATKQELQAFLQQPSG